jgi:hypothetical protein
VGGVRGVVEPAARAVLWPIYRILLASRDPDPGLTLIPLARWRPMREGTGMVSCLQGLSMPTDECTTGLSASPNRPRMRLR